jgi:hypothetical protein
MEPLVDATTEHGSESWGAGSSEESETMEEESGLGALMPAGSSSLKFSIMPSWSAFQQMTPEVFFIQDLNSGGC